MSDLTQAQQRNDAILPQLLRRAWGGFARVAIAGVITLAPIGTQAANELPPVPATRAIDALVTGATPATTPAPEKGSATFQKALDLLSAGNEADAYAMARGIDSDLERRTIQWAAIYYGGGEVDAESVRKFTEDAPDFVRDAVFKTRLEQALNKGAPSGAEVIRMLGGAMPNTVKAQIALARAYVEDDQRERAARIARHIWVENFLDRDTEHDVLDALGGLLTRDDHWARAVHLMMHDRATGAERLTGFLTANQIVLVKARSAVSRKDSDAKKLLDAIPASYQSHPVFIFSRAQRARQAGLYESAVAWLDKAPADLPDAAEWWYERRGLIRELLANGDAELAYRAADGYREGPEGRLVEARFHAGWIALAFLNDPAKAKPHFETMRGLSTLPDSVTQANYWLGRTLLALDDAEGAGAAFERGAAYPTVYYGQLSRTALGLEAVGLRNLPDWKASEAAFEGLEVIRAVRLLAANGKPTMAVPLLRAFSPRLETGAQLLLAARLAQSLNAHNLAIYIADDAEKRGIPLDLFSFPKDGLPAGIELAEVDKAAVYAITRQESHFQVDAVSSAGARGLMQLMPATARETANKVGIEYSKSRLTTDPGYNALLGSTYLAAQLARYDGSLALAAAAYNAGAGNANKWIKAFGDPRSETVDPVLWVELIPFQETRKYVQRVLGNYLVYRARLGDDHMTIEEALRRIPG